MHIRDYTAFFLIVTDLIQMGLTRMQFFIQSFYVSLYWYMA